MESSVKLWLQSFYHIEAHSIVQLHGGNWANTYSVKYNHGSLIVKILDETRTSPTEEIQNQILLFLASKNLIVRNPIPNIHGDFNTLIQIDDLDYHFTVFQKIQGFVIEEHMNLLTPKTTEILGDHLARFHKEISQGGFDSYFKFWNQQENLFTQRDFGQVQSSIVNRYQRFLKRLSQIPMRCQLIHGDLHFANLILQNDLQGIGFIDFDDIILGSPIMDLGILILDYAIMTLESNEVIIENFIIPLLSGYIKQKSLNREEILMIPVILKLLELNLYIQCYEIRDSEATWIKNFYINRTKSVLSDDLIILDFQRIDQILDKINLK